MENGEFKNIKVIEGNIRKLSKKLFDMLNKNDYFLMVYINRIKYLAKTKAFMLQADLQNSRILESTLGLDMTQNMSLNVSHLSAISLKQLDSIIQPMNVLNEIQK